MIEFVVLSLSAVVIRSLLLLNPIFILPTLSAPDEPANPVLAGCDDCTYMDEDEFKFAQSFSLTFSRGWTLQPRVIRSKPQENKFGLVSSDQAVEHTMRV